MSKKIDPMVLLIQLRGLGLVNTKSIFPASNRWNSAIHNAKCSENLRRLSANLRMKQTIRSYCDPETDKDFLKKKVLMVRCLRLLNSQDCQGLFNKTAHAGGGKAIHLLKTALAVKCGSGNEPKKWEEDCFRLAIKVAGMAKYEAVPGHSLFEAMLTALTGTLQLPINISGGSSKVPSGSSVFASLAARFHLGVTKTPGHFYTGPSDTTSGARLSCGMHSMNQLFAMMSVLPIEPFRQAIQQIPLPEGTVDVGVAALRAFESDESQERKDLLSFYCYELEKSAQASPDMSEKEEHLAVLSYLKEFKQMCHALQEGKAPSHPSAVALYDLNEIMSPLLGDQKQKETITHQDLRKCKAYLSQLDPLKEKYVNAKDNLKSAKSSLHWAEKNAKNVHNKSYQRQWLTKKVGPYETRSYTSAELKEEIATRNTTHEESKQRLRECPEAFKKAEKAYFEARSTGEIGAILETDRLRRAEAPKQDEHPAKAQPGQSGGGGGAKRSDAPVESKEASSAQAKEPTELEKVQAQLNALSQEKRKLRAEVQKKGPNKDCSELNNQLKKMNDESSRLNKRSMVLQGFAEAPAPAASKAEEQFSELVEDPRLKELKDQCAELSNQIIRPDEHPNQVVFLKFQLAEVNLEIATLKNSGVKAAQAALSVSQEALDTTLEDDDNRSEEFEDDVAGVASTTEEQAAAGDARLIKEKTIPEQLRALTQTPSAPVTNADVSGKPSGNKGFIAMATLGFIAFAGFSAAALPFIAPAMVALASASVAAVFTGPGFFAAMVILAAVALACGIAGAVMLAKGSPNSKSSLLGKKNDSPDAGNDKSTETDLPQL